MIFSRLIKKPFIAINTILGTHPFVYYIIMIFAFAGIYYIAWLCNMDSFIINDKEGSKILEFISDEKEEPILSLSYKRERLENAIKREMFVNKKISEASISEKNVEDSLRSLIIFFQESKMKAYQKDSASRFETYDRQLDSLIRLKRYITSRLDSAQKEEIGVFLSNMDVKIADIRLRKSNEDLILIKKYVSGNKYYNEELEHRINNVQDSLNKIRYNLDVLQGDSLPSIWTEHDSALFDLASTLYETVNYFDFLYYSLGIATTTTFGDFTANSGFIKVLTSLELLLGVFLLAHLVGIIQEQQHNRRLQQSSKEE